jgi:hypothetical protein
MIRHAVKEKGLVVKRQSDDTPNWHIIEFVIKDETDLGPY